MTRKAKKPTTPKPKQPGKKGLFDHLRAIQEDQSLGYYDGLTVDERKTYNIFMLNRLLSMNMNVIEVVNEMQQYYGTLDPRSHYLFYSQLLPRGRQFNRYIKPTVGDEHEEWLVDLVRSHYQISRREAEGYVELFLATEAGRASLKELLEAYGTPLKLIRKVL